MTPSDVQGLAEPLLRSAFADKDVETVHVREDDNSSGTPSLFIDVFLAHNTGPPDTDAWIRVRRTLSDELVASGEMRFPYVRLRDRQEEEEESALDKLE